jgi:hypothetical protein
MANFTLKRISELDSVTSLTGVDLIPIVQSSTNKKVTLDSLLPYTDNILSAYTAMGSPVKAFPIGLNLTTAIGNSTSLTDGRAYYTAFYLSTPKVITGVKLAINTAGNFNADNFNGVGLYSVSAGTLTQVALSANSGDIWKATAGTFATVPFTAPYTAAAGLYYVAFLWNTSDGSPAVIPQMACATSFATSFAGFDFTNSHKISGLVSSTTALPTPTIETSGITVNTRHFFVVLY